MPSCPASTHSLLICARFLDVRGYAFIQYKLGCDAARGPDPCFLKEQKPHSHLPRQQLLATRRDFRIQGRVQLLQHQTAPQRKHLHQQGHQVHQEHQLPVFQQLQGRRQRQAAGAARAGGRGKEGEGKGGVQDQGSTEGRSQLGQERALQRKDVHSRRRDKASRNGLQPL